MGERLAEALPGVHVLWLTDADVQAAAHHAPDLWTRRAAVLGFCAVPGELMLLELAGPRFDAASGMAAELQRAIVLWHQGQPALALQRLRQAVLPVFERLGGVRAKAVTMGKIADILRSRGQLDESLRIRQQEQLPVLVRLGVQRSLLVSQANLAVTLIQRGLDADRTEADALLQRAHAAANQLQLPEAARIAQIYQQTFGRPILPQPPSAEG